LPILALNEVGRDRRQYRVFFQNVKGLVEAMRMGDASTMSTHTSKRNSFKYGEMRRDTETTEKHRE